jgi:hypothetical protein
VALYVLGATRRNSAERTDTKFQAINFWTVFPVRSEAMSEHVTLRLSDLNQAELESLHEAIPDKDKYELPKEILRKHYKGIYGIDLP